MAVPRGYLGATAQTRSERRSYACPCGERFVVELHRALDVGKDPDLGRAFLAGELNLACCPACRRSAPVPVSVLWHDPIAERLVLVLSDGLRHLELEERGLLYQRLATDGEAVPDYVRGFGVVFGVPELAAVVHPPRRRSALG